MKKIFLVSAMMLVIGFYLVTTTYYAESEGFQASRNVTLIYDDSGSMWFMEDPETGERGVSDNWKLANYALQSLAALLGENDKLNVVRMSDEHQVNTIDLHYERRQQEINKVFEWEGRGNTPFDTVHTSLNHIQNSVRENPEDEYWFIIVMDGAFNDLDYNQGHSGTELENNYRLAYETMRDFQEGMEESDVSFQAVYVTMESFLNNDEVIQMARFKEEVWEPTFNGLHLRAESEQDVIERINEVAAIMTNRDREAEDANVTLNPRINGNEVILDSPYPLKRITVIQQESGRKVEHDITRFLVNGQEGNYTINGPFQIETPFDIHELRDTIYGSISHIGHETIEGVIPAGTYTLTFDEEVDGREFQFIAEPALDFEISLARVEADGSLMKEETTFFYGSDMKMLVQFIERGGEGDPLIFTSAEATENVRVMAVIEGEEHTLTWDASLQAFTTSFIMPEEPAKANVQAYIRGFYEEEKEHLIIGVPMRVWEIEASHVPWEYAIDEIGDSHSLSFTPYIDGVPITEGELRAIWDDIMVEIAGEPFNYQLQQDGNTIQLTIEEPRLLFRLASGKREVTVTVNGPYLDESASATDTITIVDIPWYKKYGVYLLYLLIVAAVVTYVTGVVTKKRFDRRGYMVRYRIQIINGNETDPLKSTAKFRSNFFKRYIIPFTPEKAVIDGFLFKAGQRKDHILLAKKSQKPNIRLGRTLLGEDAGKEDIQIFANDVVTRENNTVKTSLTYTRNERR